jgi:phosphoribosyl-dephospho-CoA transferase
MTSPSQVDRLPARRHDLVFVSPKGWRSLLASSDGLVADSLAARWPDNQWPLIRRCNERGDIRVALGLPLPPSAGKRRLSFLVPPHDVVSVSRPLSLSCVSGTVPRAWRCTLDRLEELAARNSACAKVFGSVAWQALTGLDYLSDRSDLDLLLEVRRDTDLERLAAGIATIEAGASVRLDGELVREDGVAVNWREFYAAPREILVKSIDGVGVLDRNLFIAGDMLP